MEGESLPARLARERQLPVAEAVRLAREVAEALAYAHERGIVHRDIKPANILLSAGHALVADFGIARAISGGGAVLTQTGIAIGTPQYMAPEQAMGSADVDGRVDIYALGCVLYEMIAGEPPFTGPTAQAIVARSLTETARPLTATREGLAPRVSAVVTKALAKAPADRQQSAAQVVAELHDAEDQVRSGSRPASVAMPAVGAPGKGWLVAGVIALLVLIGFVATAVRRGMPTWVLGVAGFLIGGGAIALMLTAAAEKRRRTRSPAARFDALLTWRNAALGGVAALAIWAMTATMLAVAPARSDDTGVKRVAIMPFTNQGTPDDAYFADGIVDEVRGKLATVGQLTVIASSSVDQYRNTSKSPTQIASELGVDYLLIGKVRWAGTGATRRVQVVPELVDGKTGATTWQQPFESAMTEVFQMQTSIASQVAGALGAVLGSSDEQELAARPTANAAAYDLFLKGRAIAINAGAQQREAAGYFEQAVALDSTFVEAWARLGRALTIVYTNGTRDPAVQRRAKEAIDRAIALDGSAAIPRIVAARYHLLVDRDPVAAEREVNLALRAAPRDADALAQSAAIDIQVGRLETAVEKLERARSIDPRSQTTMSTLQQTLYLLRRFDEAIAVGTEAIALEPTDLIVVQRTALSYVGKDDLVGARRVVRAAIGPSSATVVVAYFAGYNEVAWLLEPAEQQLLFRLSPAAFDNDRAWWGQSLGIAASQMGDMTRARAYADSGLATSAAQVAANPNDAQLRVLHGVALALAGHTADAIREATTALALASDQADENDFYTHLQAARIYLIAGRKADALGLLERLARVHYAITPGRLRHDPTFTSLRGDPRFERLLTEPPPTR